MKKSPLFVKLLAYLLCACLLTATLAVVIYSFTGAQVFANRIAMEMTPRANGIARLAERLQTGQISYDSFIDFATQEQQDTRIYIFDGDMNLIAYTSDERARPSASMQEKARQVLAEGDTYTSTDWRSADGVVVGVPITDNIRRVSGAVMLSRPTNEVLDSMRELISAMLLSCLIISLAMTVPAYFVSRHISKPIQKMTEASLAMAAGNFSVRADVDRKDEIGVLGQALNDLSARLDKNIRDLMLNRNRLHVILDGLGEGVMALDNAGNIIFNNPAALSLFDCADDISLFRVLRPAWPLCMETVKDQQPRTRHMTVSGKKLLLTVSFSQEMTEQLPGTVIVVQDITAAERLEQTRRDYVANVSHELRTPIASIRSLAETLNDGLVETDEDKNRYYGYILRESMRLSRLINDLLELSRLQSGAVAFEKQRFSLGALLHEVVERKRIDADDYGISVELELPPDTPYEVLTNRDRIEQVLVALLDNAIKFTSEDGHIIVSVTEAGEKDTVSVRNTGHIDEGDLPHLFERFYKADASHSKSGTGLGLAITEEVLALLGERIEAANEGEYAVFRFTVEKAEAAKA